MQKFSKYLRERVVEPEDLARRVAQQYGKKPSYGKWLKPQVGGHIPLSSYHKSSVTDLENEVYKRGANLPSPTVEKMHVNQLRATQPYVEVHDPDRLKATIRDGNPAHVRVFTHKGKHYIEDGHHAVMAAKLRGDKTIMVTRTNLDS
jgi:hypothetical protein